MKKALKIFLILFVFAVFFPACSFGILGGKKYCVGGSFCTTSYEEYKEEVQKIREERKEDLSEFREWISGLAEKEGKPVLMVSVSMERGSRGDDIVVSKIQKTFLDMGLMVVEGDADRRVVVKTTDRNRTVTVSIVLKKGGAILAIGQSSRLYGKKSEERERAMAAAATAAIADLLKGFK